MQTTGPGEKRQSEIKIGIKKSKRENPNVALQQGP